MLVCSW